LFLAVSLLGSYRDASASTRLVVMTQNQYLGADLGGIIAAPDPVTANQAVLTALAQIAAINFPERAEALAQAIAAKHPELVGLQEVFDFQLNGQHGAPPYRDYLVDTLNALALQGANYVAVASVQNVHMAFPIDFDGDQSPDAVVSIADRDVILARGDVAASVVPVPFSSDCAVPSQDGGPGCNYQIIVQVNTVGGLISIERGFIGVDATIQGTDYRFVNTHLEVREPDPTNPLSSAIQAAQAAELLGILATTPPGRPLIVVGDFSSSPEDGMLVVGPTTIVPPYLQFVTAGFTDTWPLRPGKTPGFTCCQLADLSNQQSILDERIDQIFSREVPSKVKARVVGARVSDKTRPSRLWPSDHGGVVAELEFDEEQLSRRTQGSLTATQQQEVEGLGTQVKKLGGVLAPSSP
jgi:endonuclease/exonuclease/phosphatase family metal-dependent hydrolase